mmetsp:Transcript_12381/g.30200  ORF Transcript_12381/g.30200 Transcript_12381/m.30200 type:complete len:248 (+) Transcript_12381:772-1515(+)
MRDNVSSLLLLATPAALTCCSSSPIRAQYSVTVRLSDSKSPSSPASLLLTSSALALSSSITISFALTSSDSSLTRTLASSFALSSSCVSPSRLSSSATRILATSRSLPRSLRSLVSSETRVCRLPIACFASCPSFRASAFLLLSESIAPLSSRLCSSCCCSASSSSLLLASALISVRMRFARAAFSCWAAAKACLTSSLCVARICRSSSCILALSARSRSDASLASSTCSLLLASARCFCSLASWIS